MAGELSGALAGLGGAGSGASGNPGASGGVGSSIGSSFGQQSRPAMSGSGAGPLMVVPAGLFGDILGSLAGTIGEQVGGWFGDKALGKTVGSAAGPLIKHFSPFQVLPPQLVTASAGPGDQAGGPEESLVVVPAGFLTGLLGGVGGSLLGGVVGGLFGNKKLGSDIGSAAGGALGSIFGPFSVVPAENTQTGGSSKGAPQGEQSMVLVPAGWLGDLFGGIASATGQIIGGDTGRTVAQIGGGIGKLVPWQALPPELSPASTGPDGGSSTDELVVVPAGWLGNLASVFSGTIGYGVGGLLGNAQLGKQVGDAAAPVFKMLPFSVAPQELQPQSSGPGGIAAEDKLVVVPAGVFGGLLGSFGGLLGSAVGGIWGQPDLGKTIGDTVGQFGKFLPFQVLPDGATAA